MGVRAADSGGQRHGRMVKKRTFDQLWIDIVAAADDQLLLTPVSQK